MLYHMLLEAWVQEARAFIIKLLITMLLQKNSSEQFRAQTKMKKLNFLHAVLWVAWVLLTLTADSEGTKQVYNRLFGNFLSYKTFYWSEIFFMFGGGLVLLILLIRIVPARFKYVAYVVFEAFFISIIAVHLAIFFYGIQSG